MVQNPPTLEMWNAPTEDQVHAMRQAGVAAAMGMRGSENDTDEQFLARCRERRMDSHTGISDDEFSDDPEDENELRYYQAIRQPDWNPNDPDECCVEIAALVRYDPTTAYRIYTRTRPAGEARQSWEFYTPRQALLDKLEDVQGDDSMVDCSYSAYHYVVRAHELVTGGYRYKAKINRQVEQIQTNSARPEGESAIGLCKNCFSSGPRGEICMECRQSVFYVVHFPNGSVAPVAALARWRDRHTYPPANVPSTECPLWEIDEADWATAWFEDG